MNNVAENLERLYRGFVQQSNDWQFFLGLSGYVQQIQKAAETRPLIEKLVQQGEEDHRPMAEYEALVLKETDEVAERLFAEIAKHGISDSELDEQIACYTRRGKDFIWGPTLANHLFETLSKVMERLYRLGHVELVKNYVLENQHSPGELSGFTFSKSMELKEEARQVLEEKRQRAPWNSWDHLALADFIIFESLDRSRELKSSYKDNAAAREGLNLEGCRAEMEEIRLGKVSSEETMFPKSEYLGHATRIHNYLMLELKACLPDDRALSLIPSSVEALHADVRQIKQITLTLPGAIGQLEKGVQTIELKTEAIAKNDYELRQENAELQRLHTEGLLKFVTKVKAEDFVAFATILMLGNRKRAADALGIPHRSFYDLVDKWPAMGPEYKRMFRMVQRRKEIDHKTIVRLGASQLFAGTGDEPENPETNRAFLDKLKRDLNDRDHSEILLEILEAMNAQTEENWRALNREIVAIITEVLSQ